MLIGFEPGNAPGVGTYYDFMKRIVNGPWRKPGDRKNQVKRSDYNARICHPHHTAFKIFQECASSYA